MRGTVSKRTTRMLRMGFAQAATCADALQGPDRLTPAADPHGVADTRPVGASASRNAASDEDDSQ
jgi:hypothetical protein